MKKGDICIVDLHIGSGREQVGERPAVVISDTGTSIAVVVPLTSNIEALRFPYVSAVLPDKENNLDTESAALVFHLRSIDKKRIKKIIGSVSKNDRKKIDDILKKMLNL